MRNLAPVLAAALCAHAAAQAPTDPFSAARATAAPAPKTAVTFTEHVAPIIFNNCTSCHRPGEAAPFALRDYKEVKRKARMIKRVTKSRYMPPWHPQPDYEPLKDSRRLLDEQIETIAAWVEAGMPEGDPKKLPAMPEFPDGWQLGKPDLVVEMPEAYRVRAGGADIYRNFVVPMNLPENKYVTAVEIRPSARTVLHHSLFFLDDSGEAIELDSRDAEVGFSRMGFRRSGSLGGWAVGGTPRHLPFGLALPLPKGSDLVLASHFHPSGKVEHEKTKVGLFFADKPPERSFASFQVPPQYGALAGIDIPAGKSDYTVRDTFRVPVDLELVTVGGHAHYLCRSMRAIATLPNGTKKKLFYISDWDFNWQGRYHYEQPVLLPKDTVVEAEIIWDNSKNNPKNPSDPPVRVRWGLQSTDEMGSIIFGCVAARESDYRELQRGIRSQMRRSGERSVQGIIDSLAERVKGYDKNGDGKVAKEELPRELQRWFDRLDRDGDGLLDDKELLALGNLFRRRRR